jgi:hypothetical protein
MVNTAWAAATAVVVAEEINGTKNADNITGTVNKDVIKGLNGNDTLVGKEAGDWTGPLFLGTLFPLFYGYYFSLPIFITFSFSSCCIFHLEMNSYGVRYRSAECILFWL